MKNIIINNWKITGFFDAESCFSFGVSKNKSYFEIKVTQRDYSMDALYKIQEFFNVGTVCIDNRKTKGWKWHVTNRDDCLLVLEHFKKYPLKTSKYLDYVSFLQAIQTTDIHKIQQLAECKNISRPYADRLTWCLNSAKDINED
jgi:hypothetical protein